MTDRTKCPCGCGRTVRSSLKSMYDVTLETGAMPELLDRWEAIPNANNAEKYRRDTAELHQRLVAWCHQEGRGGARAGAALGKVCGEWRKVMRSVLLAVGVVDTAFALDWMARAGGIDAAGWEADPTGRWRLRYFDGQHWTAFVNDGQSTATEADGWQEL